MNKFLIGADPEIILTENGEVISAEGLIGGTKENPKLISNKGHAVQEDNVMAEFNIPPSSSKNEFVENINYCLDYFSQIVELTGENMKISEKASAYFPKNQLRTRQAMEFGCSPDYNVYAKSQNRRPFSNTNLRSCGGHIHVGYDNPSQEKSELIVRLLDIFIGLPSISMDTDRDRKKLYGKAGSFRFKKFGVEYRTPSNFWIFRRESIEFIYDAVEKAMDVANNMPDLIPYIFEIGKQVEKAINEDNEELGKALYKEFNNQIKTNKETCLIL